MSREIKEREQATRDFEHAKESGKSASLLEQDRPNVFTMSVANMLPGDHIEVSLTYTELLVPTEGVYELVYPTVVGPRYSNQLAASAKPGTSSWRRGTCTPEEPPTANVRASAPCPAAFPSRTSEPAHNAPRPATTRPGRFALADARRPEAMGFRAALPPLRAIDPTGLRFTLGGEKQFLLMVQPPQRVHRRTSRRASTSSSSTSRAAWAAFRSTPRRRCCASSSVGLRAERHVQRALLLGRLAPARAAVVPGDDRERRSGHPAHRQGARRRRHRALAGARARARAAEEEGMSRSFVVLTDGYIDAQGQPSIFVQIHTSVTTNVFAFGIGSSVNRYLIEGVARAGQGEPFVVAGIPEQANDAARRFRTTSSRRS